MYLSTRYQSGASVLRDMTYLIAILYGLTGCHLEEAPKINPAHPPFCGGVSIERPECARPWLPYIGQVPLGGRWELSHSEYQDVRVGIADDPDAQTPKQWLETSELVFDQLGYIKVFVEVNQESNTSDSASSTFAPCEPQRFSHVYEVVAEYSAHAEAPDSEAISMSDPRLIAWAQAISSVEYGPHVSAQFQVEDHALGAAGDESFDVLSLGRGGQVTFYFEEGIANGPGPDFAVFENSFNDRFLELARVDVSTDGVHFVSIPHSYLGEEPLGAFGEHDPTLIHGLAGKYKAGYGTPFDLSTLAWSREAQVGSLDLHAVHYVRVVDIVGDGLFTDSFLHPVYDPYPTQGSAGIDIDAIGIMYTPDAAPCPQ